MLGTQHILVSPFDLLGTCLGGPFVRVRDGISLVLSGRRGKELTGFDL